MVSILLGVWNGGGRVCCCCPAQCSGVARPLLIPLQCWRVLLSCRALSLAGYCGVWVVGVCLCCLCGGVSSVCSPLAVVEGGAVVDGGWHGDEGRLCCWPPRLVCGVPLLCVGVPLVVCWVAVLNGGSGVLSWCPVFGLGPALYISMLPLALSCPSVCLLSQHCWFRVASL